MSISRACRIIKAIMCGIVLLTVSTSCQRDRGISGKEVHHVFYSIFVQHSCANHSMIDKEIVFCYGRAILVSRTNVDSSHSISQLLGDRFALTLRRAAAVARR